MLVDRVPGHEDLTAMVAFESGYGNVTAHVILHVAQLSELFLTHVALKDLVKTT